MRINASENLPLLFKYPVDFVREFGILCNLDCKISETAKHIIVCAAPKSASSFIKLALLNILDVSDANLAEGYSVKQIANKFGYDDYDTGKEILIPTHQIYFPALFCNVAREVATLSRHHIIADTQTLWNLKKISDAVIIVTTRNIKDALLSMRDHIVKAWNQTMSEFDAMYFFGSNIGWHFLNKNTIEKFVAASFDYQMDFIIDHCAPWYYQFYLSWEEVYRNSTLDILFWPYEKMIQDEYAMFKSAIEFTGAKVDELKIKNVLFILKKKYKKQILYNKAKVGRGDELLTKSQKNRILKIGQYYADDGIISKYYD